MIIVISLYDWDNEYFSSDRKGIHLTVTEIPDCPWYTTELNKLKRERRKAEYKWRKSKSEQDHEAFKRCRNRFRNKCKTKKLEC